MKTIKLFGCLGILLFGCFSASAGTFAGQWIMRDSASNVMAFKQVDLQPIASYGTDGGTVIISGDKITKQATSAGSLIVSNMFNGRSYRVKLTGYNFETVFTNSFDTNVTGLVNCADPAYLVAPIRDTTTIGYSQAAADSRFLKRTNGSGRDLTLEGTNTFESISLGGEVRDTWPESGVTQTDVDAAATNALDAAVEFTTSVSNNITARTPQHANLSRLQKFRAKLMKGNEPVKIFYTTDEATGTEGGAESFPGDSLYPFRGLLRKEGGLTSGGGMAGDIAVHENANVFHINTNNQPDIFLGTDGYYTLTNGGILTFSRAPGSGTGLADTNHFCDTFKFFYLKEPRGDNVTVQTNLNGQGWGTIATVNTSGSGTNGVWYSTTLSNGFYSFRLLHTGGGKTNRIRTVQIYNSQTNVLVIGGALVNSGGQISHITDQCLTNVSWPYFTGLSPDLFMFQDFAETNNIGALATLHDMFAYTCTNADVITFGEFFIEGTTPGGANDHNLVNTGLRNLSLQYGWGYFDTLFYIPDSATHTDWTNRLWLQTDGSHLTSAGIRLMNSEVWRHTFAETVSAICFSMPSRFNGAGAAFLQGRLGTVYNLTNFGVLFTSSGGPQGLTFGNADSSTPWILFGTSGKTWVYGTATGTLGFRGTNGIYWQVLSDGSVGGHMFPSGGMYFGGEGTDPGAGNLAIAGNYFGGAGGLTGTFGGTVNSSSLSGEISDDLLSLNVVKIIEGDQLSGGSLLQFDGETWSETHSAASLTDLNASRLNTGTITPGIEAQTNGVADGGLLSFRSGTNFWTTKINWNGSRLSATGAVESAFLNLAKQGYTWATRPGASTNTGNIIHISDLGRGGSEWISDGIVWKPVNGQLILALAAPATASTNGTSEQFLYTNTIPGGVMISNASITVSIITTNGAASTKNWKIRFGGNSGTAYRDQGIAGNASSNMGATIQNQNSTAAQEGIADATGGSGNPVTSTVATTSDVDVVISVTKGTGSEAAVLKRVQITLVTP